MTDRTPTPQSISRLLAKAGFTRVEGRYTGGFSTAQIRQGEGAVRVRHWFLSMRGTDAQHRAELERYAEVITEAGYTATIDGDGRRLIVTANHEGDSQ